LALLSPIDIIKRAFDNTVANWPLLLVRIALSMVILIVAVVAAVAVVIPMVISAGLTKFDRSDPTAVLTTILTGHWLLLIYLLIVAGVVLTVLCLVYSFAQSGSARIYLDGEGAAGAPPVQGRERFAAFDPQRWFQGAVDGTWRVFWIYNIAWTIALAVIVVPLAFAPAIMYLGGGGVGAIAAGCGLLLLVGAAALVLFIATDAVLCKAIVIAVERGAGPVDALRTAVADFRADFSRNFTVVFILIVLHIGGAGVLSLMGIAGSIGHRLPGISLVFVPTQVISSLLQTVFGAFMESWALAAFVAIDAERNRSHAQTALRHQPSVITEVIRID
jgi:hypothetical protein